MTSTWTEDLIPGEKVAYYSRYDATPEIVTVERLTKTQIILKNKTQRFRRSDGDVVGKLYDRWSGRPTIEEYAPDIEEKINEEKRRKAALHFLKHTVDFSSLTTDVLYRIVEVVQNASKT